MTKRQKYLYGNKDRHGNSRWYFKPPNAKKTRLKHAEGTTAFRQEYLWLVSQWESGIIETTKRVTLNSFEWLKRQYESSAAFKNLARNTQSQRSNFYTRFCRAYGDIRAADLTTSDISAVRDSFGDKKWAARNFVKAMRAVYAWACSPDVGILTENPASNVTLPTGKTEGHMVWSMQDVQKMKDFYPEGHNARICLALLLFTGQRISDVRVMGRASVQGNYIQLRQVKTGNKVELVINQILRNELGAKFSELIWLQSIKGAPYSEKSISMRFGAWARAAGLENRTAHGLRKSVGTILAELGMSEDVIMSILGHTSADEVRTYIQTSKRRELAEKGMIEFGKEIAGIW